MSCHLMKFLKVAGFLAIAITAYIMTGPEDGMISGPSTVSMVLHSFPIINF